MEDRNTLNFEALDLEGLQQQLMAEAKSEFIFRENEFESLNFSPSNFISKYRRIDSLESIKEQLQLYCKGLKQELYDIINRDYAEFITIATKLDGVDSRIDHLRKPLINLRLDLASLQDNIVVSVKTIQLKLKQKENINNRKNAIKASLDCMMHVDVADNIINNNPADYNSKEKKTFAESIKKAFPNLGICFGSDTSIDISESCYDKANIYNFLKFKTNVTSVYHSIYGNNKDTQERIKNITEQAMSINKKAVYNTIISNSPEDTQKYLRM